MTNSATYARRYRERNRDKVRAANRAYMRRKRAADPEGERAKLQASYRRQTALRRAFVNALKDNPCADCGLKYPPLVMDFHHVRGVKLYRVATMVNSRKSYEAIQAEVDKCVLVCANCHRLRHHKKGSSQ